MNKIDYNRALENISEMINVLEYDSSRSPGKAKVNAQGLVALYSLQDRYEAKMKSKPGPKPKAEV